MNSTSEEEVGIRGVSKPLALALGLAALAPVDSAAQVTASERSTLTQQISGTEIVIDYARPSVRGREPLFGGLVPWGRVWTPGANDATTFHFSKDVSLNGQDVPAGTYSIWMQPQEQAPWVLMLHADTTLFHVPHPSLDEAFATIPVEPRTAAGFTETLTFDIQGVRADRAELQFRWGSTVVPMDLGVDPGYVLTVEADDAARFVGTWLVDASMARPPDSVVAQWKRDATPDEVESIDAYIATLGEAMEIRLEFDEATGHLYGFDPATATMMGDDPANPQYLLLPTGDGIFNPGMMMGGELAFVFEEGFWEFEFDAAGSARVLVQRGPDDRVMGRGMRSGGR